MSRTDHTRPYHLQLVDANKVMREGMKLVEVHELVSDKLASLDHTGLSLNNRGQRKYWQRDSHTQRRQRDRHFCHEARFNPEVDFAPVAGDRPCVDWRMD